MNRGNVQLCAWAVLGLALWYLTISMRTIWLNDFLSQHKIIFWNTLDLTLKSIFTDMFIDANYTNIYVHTLVCISGVKAQYHRSLSRYLNIVFLDDFHHPYVSLIEKSYFFYILIRLLTSQVHILFLKKEDTISGFLIHSGRYDSDIQYNIMLTGGKGDPTSEEKNLSYIPTKFV